MNGTKSNIPVLAIMFASAFVGGFNENLVNMALVSIMAEYSIDSVTSQWLVSGYMVLSTVVVMCMAFLFRRVKLRVLFFTGIAFSFVGSVVGYFSSTFEILMVSRLIQAIGTGIFIPMMMNVIVVIAPKNRIGQFMSLGSCMITFGPALAPVLCGLLVTIAGWHSIFLLPAVALLVLGVAGVPLVKNLETQELKLDIFSVVLSGVFLLSLCTALAYMTIDVVLAGVTAAICAVSAFLFVVRQKRVDNPLIDMTPMKQKTFWPSILINVIAMMGAFSMSVLLPVYFESAIGLTAMVAGLVLLVPVLCNCGVALIGGKIFDRFGEWPLLPAGFFFAMLGFGAMAVFAGQLSLPIMIVAAMFVYGFTGLIFAPSQTAGLRTLSPEMSAHGVALTTTFVQIAACIGPSLYTGLLTTGLNSAVASGANTAQATGTGFSLAMLVASCLALCGVIVAFIYSRYVSKKRVSKKVESKVSEPKKPTIKSVIVEDPYVLKFGETIEDALNLMLKTKVSGFTVVDDNGKAWGYLSDGDIMRYMARSHPMITSVYSLVEMKDNLTFEQRLQEMLTRKVEEIATQGIISLDINSTLEDACNILGEKKLKKIPVLDSGTVVGTINRSDVLRFALSLSV